MWEGGVGGGSGADRAKPTTPTQKDEDPEVIANEVDDIVGQIKSLEVRPRAHCAGVVADPHNSHLVLDLCHPRLTLSSLLTLSFPPPRVPD